MAESDFKRQQRAAVERMREMNSRSQFRPQNNKTAPQNSAKREPPKNSVKQEPKPPEQKKSSNSAPCQNNNGFLNLGLNIPFLDDLVSDGDSAILVGLLLLLMNEKSDKILLFALAYILL